MHAYKAKKKPIDPLQKRIPRNPKYANVKSTIDTGASITKYMQKIEEIRENYRFRKDEIFKRMKAATFVQLMVQVAEINQGVAANFEDEDEDFPIDSERTLQEDDDGEGDGHGEYNRPNRATSAQSLAVSESDYGRPVSTARSTLHSVISGVGELDANGKSAVHLANWPEEAPYLLLDVRDREDYDRYRIIGAVSYPHTMLSRAQNYEIPEMLACRNRPGRIILVYDDDEKTAPRVATTLVQRGYDNLFLLSGGLKVAVKLFPEGLVTGTVPDTSRSTSTAGGTQRSRVPAMGPGASATDQLDIDKLAMALDRALDSRASTTASTARSSVVGGANRRPTSTSSAASSVGSSVSQKPPFK